MNDFVTATLVLAYTVGGGLVMVLFHKRVGSLLHRSHKSLLGSEFASLRVYQLSVLTVGIGWTAAGGLIAGLIIWSMAFK
ncbi:MAG: hypothetical protein HY681_15005 [Chloroflexi bacterium]|nr:hypothetical protein [Chloroflexota bacterium]